MLPDHPVYLRIQQSVGLLDNTLQPADTAGLCGQFQQDRSILYLATLPLLVHDRLRAPPDRYFQPEVDHQHIDTVPPVDATSLLGYDDPHSVGQNDWLSRPMTQH